MLVTIRSNQLHVNDKMKEVIEKKLSKLDKFFMVTKDTQANVLIKRYKDGDKIEVTIPTEYVVLRAEHKEQDLYDALDVVVDKLMSQLRRYKTRLSRKNKEKMAFNFAMIEDVPEQKDEVVRTKQIHPKPMDLDEAIMQMELIGHSFYVYKDKETEFVNVVYKRDNGGYGLIETD